MNKMSIGKRQNGVVAILVGISMFLFAVLLALVIDLGRLYVAKTGLQNAADAAALSGAKELIQTGPGITAARDRAIEAAGLNTYFGDVVGTVGVKGTQPVVLAEDNIMFSDSPYTPDADWLSYSEALAAPVGLTFIKVDTGSQSLHTLFGLWERFMSTFGRAVAGRFVTNVTPIGVCAIEADESDEFGFRRGVGYSFADVNERLGGLGAGTELYLHPTATSSVDCAPSGGNAGFIEPFLCKGQSSISGISGSKVFTNTGLATCKALGSLNTRFDQYDACLDAALTPDACRPDANIKEYNSATADDWMNPQPYAKNPNDLPAVATDIAKWLAGQPQPPTASFPGFPAKEDKGGCGGADCTDNYGVLWSYTRPNNSDGNCPNCPTPSPSSPSEWASLYPSGPTAAGTLYGLTSTASCADPDEPGAPVSPYCYGLQTEDAKWYKAPNPTHSKLRGRRLINVVIVKCPIPFGIPQPAGVCGELGVVGVGQFFLQASAGGSRWISGEFVKLIEPGLLDPTIRLYQ